MRPMRRGLILLLIGITVVLAGVGVFAWSSPGQALWLRAKLKYRIVPAVEAMGGIDSRFLISAMEPQWSRLIDRGYVSWYQRRFPGPALTDAATAEFWRRVRTGLAIPAPFEIVSAMEYHGAADDPTGPIVATTITLLVPESQHRQLDAWAKELFGQDGVAEPPRLSGFWNLDAYMTKRR
jgi:hypothetical protein